MMRAQVSVIRSGPVEAVVSLRLPTLPSATHYVGTRPRSRAASFLAQSEGVSTDEIILDISGSGSSERHVGKAERARCPNHI